MYCKCMAKYCKCHATSSKCHAKSGQLLACQLLANVLYHLYTSSKCLLIIAQCLPNLAN